MMKVGTDGAMPVRHRPVSAYERSFSYDEKVAGETTVLSSSDGIVADLLRIVKPELGLDKPDARKRRLNAEQKKAVTKGIRSWLDANPEIVLEKDQAKRILEMARMVRKVVDGFGG